MQGCPFNYVKSISLCASFMCNYSSDVEYLCHGKNVILDNFVIHSPTCKSQSIVFKERFGKNVKVSASPVKRTCKHHYNTVLFFPSGMLDEWNPYEGLHQHTAAFMSLFSQTHAIGAQKITRSRPVVVFPTVSRKRSFPLQSLWNSTFTFLENPEAICAKNIIIPMGSERSLNTFHQKTCDHKGFADNYRRWVLNSFRIFPSINAYPKVVFLGRPSSLRRHEKNGNEICKSLTFPSFQSHTPESVQQCKYVPSLHTFHVRDQLKIVAGADILISTHGAQLTWLFALPACGQVIEILGHPHYRQMASLFNIGYHKVNTSIQWTTIAYNIPIQSVQNAVQKAIKKQRECLHV